jgi:hypothetical protein
MVRWKVWYLPFPGLYRVEVWDEGREAEKFSGCVLPRVGEKWIAKVRQNPPETAQQAYELLRQLAGVK